MSEKPGECESCNFETVDITKYDVGTLERQDHWYCNLCASTMTSRFAHELRIQPSNRDVMQTVCYVGNAILQALKERAP